MDFPEYMCAINATSLSTPQDKLEWVFNIFDKDGGGTIDSNEIETMLVGLFEMSGAEVNEEDLKETCEEIMAAIDGDGDGEVTREEWVTNAMGSEFISSLLT